MFVEIQGQIVSLKNVASIVKKDKSMTIFYHNQTGLKYDYNTKELVDEDYDEIKTDLSVKEIS